MHQKPKTSNSTPAATKNERHPELDACCTESMKNNELDTGGTQECEKILAPHRGTQKCNNNNNNNNKNTNNTNNIIFDIMPTLLSYEASAQPRHIIKT
jgi:hypothetical protein